jgi:hypothetical protein
MNNENGKRLRYYAMAILFFIALVLIIIALTADLSGVDRTPGFGMIQMVLFLLGVTFLTFGIFVYLRGLHPVTKSLQASIGTRLAATGLMFAYVAGLADLFSIGTHPHPDYGRPFVGWLQISGIGLGIFSILLGILLYYTSSRIQENSSMGFIVNGNNE